METEQNDPSYKQSSEADLSNFHAAKSKSLSKKATGAGVISVINAKTGKRLSLSDNLMAELDYPKTVKFSLSDTGVVIAEDLPNNLNQFVIRESKNQYLVYSTSLVGEITEAFNLDYTNKTSITFYDVKYFQHNGIPLAMIPLSYIESQTDAHQSDNCDSSEND